MSGNVGPRLQPGTILDNRYRIEALAGVGGMSSVYRATDTQLGRTVALKLFSAQVSAESDLRRRTAEIRMLASLDHPALVTLFDVADGEHGTFAVMQFVEGEDLSDRLASGPLSPAAVAEIGGSVASALAYVHGKGIIHRDVKPGNILLPREAALGTPSALVADFGIARLIDDATLTATGSVIGTAQYLSPEQALGRDLTGATDIYSLGLLLLEALTGERSFSGSGIEAVSARLHRDPEVPARLGTEWGCLLRSMTSREPAGRPDAASVAASLAALPTAFPAEVTTAAIPADAATVAMTAAMTSAGNTAETAAFSPTRVMPIGNDSTERIAAAPSPSRRSRRPAIIVAAGVLAAVVVASVVVAASLGMTSPTETVEPASTPTPSVTTAVVTPVIETPAAEETPTPEPLVPENGPGKSDDKDKGPKDCKGKEKKAGEC